VWCRQPPCLCMRGLRTGWPVMRVIYTGNAFSPPAPYARRFPPPSLRLAFRACSLGPPRLMACRTQTAARPPLPPTRRLPRHKVHERAILLHRHHVRRDEGGGRVLLLLVAIPGGLQQGGGRGACVEVRVRMSCRELAAAVWGSHSSLPPLPSFSLRARG